MIAIYEWQRSRHINGNKFRPIVLAYLFRHSPRMIELGLSERMSREKTETVTYAFECRIRALHISAIDGAQVN